MKRLIVVYFVYQLLLTSAQNNTGIRPIDPTDDDILCEPLISSRCSNLGYAMAFSPNDRGHTTQQEALNEMDDFFPLVDAGCSNLFLDFLCAFYLPPCFIVSGNVVMIRPCKSLCEYVTPPCSTLIQEQSDFPWPVFFNCSLDSFPEDDPCFKPPALSATTHLTTHLTTITTPIMQTDSGQKITQPFAFLAIFCFLIAS